MKSYDPCIEKIDIISLGMPTIHNIFTKDINLNLFSLFSGRINI